MADVSEIVILICELAKKMGVTPIKSLWRVDLGEWVIWVNGAEEAQTEDGVRVDPFGFYGTFNGWPAMVFGPDGKGEIAAGESANIRTLRLALKRRVDEITAN